MSAESVRCASCRKALQHGVGDSWFGPAGYALCADCRFAEDRGAGELAVEQVVRAAAEARARALVEGDAAALERLLHEDFRWRSHAGDTFDRSEYIRRNTSGPVAWRSQQLLDVEVTVVGDTAVLLAEAVDVVSHGGGEETFRMPVTQ